MLIITYTDDIFNNLPLLKTLFTDNTNFILIVLLVLLVLLINIPIGVVLAFLVLYLSVHINYSNKKKVEFNDVKTFIPSKDIDIDNDNNYNNIKNHMFLPEQKKLNYSSESEFIYDNTKPFPNNNIKPFEPVIDNIDNMPNKNFILPINSNLIIENVDSNRDGYDISGCRYDFVNDMQNLTKNGKPLALCSTYDSTKIKTCGTVFYPLNP